MAFPTTEYGVVGLRLDVLNQLASVEAVAEYDTRSGALFVRVGRQVLPGLAIHLRRAYNQGTQQWPAAGAADGNLVLRVDWGLTL